MTAQPPATGPYSPVSAVQVDLWGNDSPETPQGHTAPVGHKTTDGRIKQPDGRYLSPRRARSLARRERKVTRRLYVPVDDLLLEDLAIVAKASGTSIPELARVVLYRGMGLAL